MCGRRGKIRREIYQHYGATCAWCKNNGPLPTESDVKSKYPCIIAAVTLNKQGRIRTQDFVLAKCVICDTPQETRYRNVVCKSGAWNCRRCGKLNQVNGDILFAKDLPDYVVDFESNSLGSMGRLTAKTIVYTRCPNCSRLQERPWHNVSKHGEVRCKSCVTSGAWGAGTYDQHGEKIKALWETDEYRKAALENRQDNGFISGLHADVKSALNAFGLTQFWSEQYVHSGVRVDEVDRKNKIVLEVYGDYWHFNPAKYDGNASYTRNGQSDLVKNFWERDRQRVEKLKKAGYSVYIIWESDFRTDPERSIATFAEWLETIKMGQAVTAV
jgi:G:T-mismatch repair DNA endonuclease (very short patch repair protein)